MSGAPYRDNQRIDHMLDALKSIVKTADGVSRNALFTEDYVTKSLMYDLIVLGEAANNISREFAERHPEIEWAEIAGLRHKLVHDYAGVNYDILWNVVQTDIPKLLPKIQAVHDTLPKETLSDEVKSFL